MVRQTLGRLDVDVPVWFVNRHEDRSDGVSERELRAALARTDLVLNVGGVSWLPEFELATRRALVDMDPLFTQVAGFSSNVLDGYDVHFSYGANIGSASCAIPTCGHRWHPLRPPVVEELWPVWREPQRGFTTIANWTAYGGVTHAGERYGQKDEEFMELIELPRDVSVDLELALSGASDEVRGCFRDWGWSVADGGDVSVDLETYHDYISGSLGELSAAKHAYVKTRSGWFSDRSACYLASGRPVVLQDTGFSSSLPCGVGLLAFDTRAQAAAAAANVVERYQEHRRAAREIALEWFSYRKVLPGLLTIALEEPAPVRETEVPV
jgi:hypothetical protein